MPWLPFINAHLCCDKQKGTWTAEDKPRDLLSLPTVFSCPLAIWIFSELSPFKALNDCQGKGVKVLSWSQNRILKKLWDTALVKVTPEGAEDRINGTACVSSCGCFSVPSSVCYSTDRSGHHSLIRQVFTAERSLHLRVRNYFSLGTTDRTMNSVKICLHDMNRLVMKHANHLKFLLVLLSTFYP